ncbi:pentatricopeptide repeat protein [Hortaea werneckii]|nr:pentatricopeptide repeat protein [Hortaea werneckii]
MPYVKPTVHLSRLAGNALKSFTHGYAQSVVAASQSSYAAQNTQPGPLADTLLGKLRKNQQSRVHNVLSNADGARQASTNASHLPASQSGTKPEAVQQGDSGLEKYFDAWQKHQRNGGTSKDWQQFQLARRVEWQPPTTVPPQAAEAEITAAGELEAPERKPEEVVRGTLKRSYTTSALDNFGKAFGEDEAAEAAALQQVNDSLAEEILKSKEDSEDGLTLRAASPSAGSDKTVTLATSTPPTTVSPTDSALTSEAEIYAQELLSLAESNQYERVPAAFKAMLHAGVQQPTPAAYRALLCSAIELTSGKHLKVPKALEVYSDMLRRDVTPDSETFSIFVGLLARRASQALDMRKDLEERLTRYGGLEEAGTFMFRSTEAEYRMLSEDSSLLLAVKIFDRAIQSGVGSLSSEACAALVMACAEQGRLEDVSRIHQYMRNAGMDPVSSLYPPMIAAFGQTGDLKSAVEAYDQYKELAIAHNAGELAVDRLDNEVYASLVKAYGSADRLKEGLKFLSSVQSGLSVERDALQLRDTVALQALLPLALKDTTFRNAFDLVNSLTGCALPSALASVTIAAADKNMLEVSSKAFDSLAKLTSDLAEPATAMLAMHLRNANVEAAEPYSRILESAPAKLHFVEPITMRTVAFIGVGQAERGLVHARKMFGRIRDQASETNMAETVAQIDEALELIGTFILKSAAPIQGEAAMAMLTAMIENGGLIAPIAEHIVARLGPDHIARLGAGGVEMLTRVQAGMLLDESSPSDIAGPARFGCLLENIVSRSLMPSTETETLIERTLINIDRAELSRLWNSYRYPSTPAFTPVVPLQQPVFVAPAVQPVTFDDSFDPYASRTDIKGSNFINDLLERPSQQGKRISEALTKFRNMRRVGRVPRMFTYGKLIESAAKENNLGLAHDILEMAKQDVPYDARYRVVRFGWQQILDHMIAGCLNIGRRDLAARYHQDLLDMGAAPSANTFGLYITTLKETTKTFDEASEAVKIFLRAKTEGVEPSSFLYNALIGKLGKARRIDDCLFYFAEMRNLGIRPTSVTYGTIVNALCRVSDEKFAEEIFEEMEACTNYKPRPAPYHSLMQFFLTTKRDRSKVLSYYERMRSQGIEPTVHTFKLLIDTHATLEPINMPAAEAVLQEMKLAGIQPEAVHYASLIHAKGCVMHDLAGSRALFDSVVSNRQVRLQPCIYQAMFESLNANHAVTASADVLLDDMLMRRVEFTPYIANALIHGWAQEANVAKAKQAFERVPLGKREPSTYEAMVRACLAAEEREQAKQVVREALGRGYPNAVAGKIADLVR